MTCGDGTQACRDNTYHSDASTFKLPCTKTIFSSSLESVASPEMYGWITTMLKLATVQCMIDLEQ